MERSHCNDEMTCSGLLSGKTQLENRLPTYRKLRYNSQQFLKNKFVSYLQAKKLHLDVSFEFCIFVPMQELHIPT